MKTKTIIAFTEGAREQLSLLGGKGANLAELTQAGFPVPQGFFVTTRGYQQFMDQHPHNAEIFQLLSDLQTDDLIEVQHVGSQIRTLLTKGSIPAVVEDELKTIFHSYAPDTRFAVRSSATAEDLPDASFAGQQDTYLNVQGLESLAQHIKKCWISLFTDRAIVYRVQQHFNHQDVQLSVVVQKMVESESSGILFTADPLSGNRAEIVINAGFGLGEALVSGIITPDTYQISKSDPTDVKIEIGSKHAAIQYAVQGGTEKISLPVEKQEAQVLSSLEIQQLADMGKDIESHYGTPQDIEWAKVDGKFYILQTRPITTLFPLPMPYPVDGNEHVYLSFGHLQMMTDTMSPMGISIITWILPFGKSKTDKQHSKYFLQAAGRIYVDVSELVQNPLLNKRIITAFKIADPLVASGFAKIKVPKRKISIVDLFNARPLLRFVIPTVLKTIQLILFADPQKDIRNLNQNMEHWINTLQVQLADCNTALDRLLLLNVYSCQKMVLALKHFPPRILAGILSLKIIPLLLPGESIEKELQAIQRSVYGNITTEMDLQIGDLAGLVNEDKNTVQRLLKMPAAQAAKEILATLERPEHNLQWQAFLDKYGFRGPGEIDIANPRWQENPLGLTNMLLGNLSTQNGLVHRERIQEVHLQGDQATETLIQLALKKPFGRLRAYCIRRNIRSIRHGLGIREHPKYFIMKMMRQIKSEISTLGKQWADQGLLYEKNDIFWLSSDQMLAGLQSELENLQQVVSQNKYKWAQYKKMVPPRVITSSGIIPPVDYSHEDLPTGALPGNPVSAGEVVGIARVILDPHTETILPGEILIAPFTDPGWTPLFIHAAGLVMELGGSMTHGSVVAREYGIPAVAGVINATQKIKSGMKIRVDGNKGFVEILE
ncbi:MAG: phosphoenolpyruvate synthase [Anaerolineaceae bacterium]|nr:phosphoenolpyruvate synthase [Anaerolineaceae bacterium]